jgi:hypothetical protein
MAKSYEELVAKAEGAVSKVKDAELRRVAFEKVLDDLLGAQTGTSTPRHTTVAAVPTKKKSRRSEAGGHAQPRTRRRGGPQAYVTELADEGFFKKPKTIAQVKAELANRGHHIPLTSLSGPLQTLCQRKVLRRQKTKGHGKKQTFNYSDW